MCEKSVTIVLLVEKSPLASQDLANKQTVKSKHSNSLILEERCEERERERKKERKRQLQFYESLFRFWDIIHLASECAFGLLFSGNHHDDIEAVNHYGWLLFFDTSNRRL